MTMKTRLITIIAAVFSCCAALHAQVIDSGKLSGDQSWTLTADGTLTVSGTGKIILDDFTSAIDYDLYESVWHIVFEEGITGMEGHSSFYGLFIPCITLPSTIQSINLSPYYACCVICNAETPPILNHFWGANNVVVPTGTVESYRNSDWATLSGYNGWKVRIIEYDDLDSDPVSVNVSTPGMLAGEIAKSGHTVEEITSVAVSGTLGDEDFAFLRDGMPNLLSLDLSAVSATSLPVALFKDNALLRCTLPKSLTSISDSLFYNACVVEGISIPSGVTAIGSYAFAVSYVLCDDYTQVIPSRLESCGEGAFKSCHFQKGKVTIPDGMTDIPDRAFSGSNISEVTIPESVTSIGEEAFLGLRLTSIIIPNSVTHIGSAAFFRCSSLASVSISESVSSIPDSAFYECTSLDEVIIPQSVTSIGGHAFEYCLMLTGVVIPESTISIGANAFNYCLSLTSITIPESVAAIGEDAFSYSSLTGITVPGSVAVVDAGAFSGCYRLKKAVFAEGVKSIGRGVFYGCDSLTHIFIPEGVTIVGNPIGKEYPLIKSLIIRSDMDAEDAEFDFLAADSLRVIEVPANMLNVNRGGLGFTRPAFDSVTVTAGTLDYKGFEFLNLCRSTLRYINLSKAENTELPDEALAECLRADSIVLPANLERIGCSALRGCMALKSIDIPASVTEIDDNAFENCFSLLSINFGGTEGTPVEAGRAAVPAAQSALRRIGNWAFYNCHRLQHLVIPEGVTEIGDAAFYGCTYLEDLELPSTVTRIGDNCFALCSKLKQIRVRAAVPPEIEAKTFYDVNREIPVYVPEDYLDDYREDPYWREFNLIGEDQGGTVGTDHTSIDGLYRMEEGRIVLTEEMPVSVYTATGALVYSGTATEVALPAPGVYLLRIGEETVKVVRP